MPLTVAQLNAALTEESAQWEAWRNLGLHKGEGLVTVAQRNEAARWTVEFSCRTGPLGPDTVVTSVWLMDKILTLTRVQPKYLPVMTAACVYLAAKLCEEAEAVPRVSEIVGDSWVNCSVAELVRMERVLLNKLDWEVSIVSPLTFLQMMLVVLVPDPFLAAVVLNQLTGPLYAVLQDWDSLVAKKPSLIAAELTFAAMALSQQKNWEATKLHLLNVIQRCRFPVMEMSSLQVRQLLIEQQQELSNVVKSPVDVVVSPVKWKTPSKKVAGSRSFVRSHHKSLSAFANGNRFQPLQSLDNGHRSTSWQLPLISGVSCAGEESRRFGHPSSKRQRVKSRTDEGMVGSENIFVDEIYDAVDMLYGGDLGVKSG